MNILRKRASEHTDEEYLKIQTARLENSPYDEDKAGALQEIQKIAQRNAFLVGITSLTEITNSIQFMENCCLQIEILNKIFQSAQKAEFIDIFLKDDNNILILADNIAKTPPILNTLLKFAPLQIYDVLSRNNVLYKVITNCFLFLNTLKYMITAQNSKIFVNEGIFEEILDIIDEYNVKECSEILCKLLKDQVDNQNYFVELNWKSKTLHLKCYDVFVALLDPKNSRFKDIQEFICTTAQIDLQNSALISGLVRNNQKNLQILLDKGLDLDYFIKKMSSQFNKLEIQKTLELISVACYYHNFNLDFITSEHEFYYYIMCIIILSRVENDNYFQVTSKEFFNEAVLTLSALQNFTNSKLFGLILYLCLVDSQYQLDYTTFQIISEFFKSNLVDDLKRSVFILLFVCCGNRNKSLNMNDDLLRFHFEFLVQKVMDGTFICTQLMKNFILQKFCVLIDSQTQGTTSVRSTIPSNGLKMSGTEYNMDSGHKTNDLEQIKISETQRNIENVNTEDSENLIESVKIHKINSPALSSKIDRIKNWKNIFNNHPVMQVNQKNSPKKDQDSEENIYDL